MQKNKMNDKGTEPQQRPYFIPKEQREQREQSAVLRAVVELVKALAEAAPRLDHTCKVVKKP